MAHTVTRLDGRCPGRLKEAGEGLEVVTLLQVQRAVLGHVMRLDHLTIRQRCSLFNHGDAKDARGHLQNQVCVGAVKNGERGHGDIFSLERGLGIALQARQEKKALI